MPRYFFHLRYGPDKLAADPEGEILADPHVARAHALAAAGDLIARTRSDFVHDWFVCSFEIVDEAGEPVLTLPFGEAVAQEPDRE